MRVHVFATDVTPIPGVPTSGTALRTQGFVNGFLNAGHEVVVSVPKMALGNQLSRSDLQPEARSRLNNLACWAFDHANADDLILESNPDLIYCGHWPTMCFRRKPSAQVILDLAGPHLLERYYQGTPDHGGALRAKLINIASADYFVVSGKRQLQYFRSFFDRARLNDAPKRTIVVPMMLSPDVPTRASTSRLEPKFLFAGIFLPWQNPSAGLRTLVKEMEARQRGNLRLIGGPHPTYPIAGGVYQELFEDLEKSSRVSRTELLPFNELEKEMLDCDVALDLMSWNLERELAVTIRTTTYLWSGLPVIYNNFSDLSDLIDEYDAGWCVDPENEEQLKSVIDEILTRPEIISEKSRNAQQLALEYFAWDIQAMRVLDLVESRKNIGYSADFIYDRPEHADFFLGKGTFISQEFTCRKNGLTEVEVNFSGSGTADLELLCLEKPEVHYQARIKIEKSKAHFWRGFKFAPQMDSAGKTFLISITSADKTLSPLIGKSPCYPLKEFCYGGRNMIGYGLNLKALCQHSPS